MKFVYFSFSCVIYEENIIMSNMSLVITRTTRRNAGKYLCWASNAEGRSISNPLTLDVHCNYIDLSLCFAFFAHSISLNQFTSTILCRLFCSCCMDFQTRLVVAMVKRQFMGRRSARQSPCHAMSTRVPRKSCSFGYSIERRRSMCLSTVQQMRVNSCRLVQQLCPTRIRSSNMSVMVSETSVV